jgi:polyene glycosyltransferase
VEWGAGVGKETEAAGRILLASWPSFSTINPLLAIAAELNARGVTDLWFASTDERRADVERIRGEGRVRFVSLGWSKVDPELRNWDDATLGSMTTGSHLRDFAAFLDAAVDHEYSDHLYRQMLAVIDEVQPCLMVVDGLALWTMDAAMMRGVPFIVSIPVPVSHAYMEKLPWSYPTPFSGLPREMTPTQKITNAAFRVGILALVFRPKQLRSTLGSFRKRKAEGLPNPAALRSRYADAAVSVLGCSVWGLEYPFPAAPSHLSMVGAVVPSDVAGAAEGGELSGWLDRHESVVYVGFGTIMRPSRRQVRALVDVCAALAPEHQVLWKLPVSAQELLPAALPGNLRVEGWVPSQVAVLAHPHVRVFFNHGGGNAVHEGLFFGKPLLVMPFWLDCHDFAVRVVDSGAGLSVRHVDELDRDDIVGKLKRLLGEPVFRERAEYWAGCLRAAGGAAAAADIVLRNRDQILHGPPAAQAPGHP